MSLWIYNYEPTLYNEWREKGKKGKLCGQKKKKDGKIYIKTDVSPWREMLVFFMFSIFFVLPIHFPLK